MKRPEQAERTTRRRGDARASDYHRHLKRFARRMMRRLWRTKGEDAPRRVPFRGWET